MISIDGSVIIQIINFLFLIWVLNIILYRPIRNMLLQRKEKIDGLEQKIDTFQADAKERDAAFAAGIKEARTKGLEEKKALMAQASEEERRIIDEINRKAQENLTKVQEKIAQDTEAVRVSLLKEVDTFADVIGGKILGRTV